MGFVLSNLQQASSESESGVFSMSSSFSDDEDMAWSHSWPSTAWHCFLKGTQSQSSMSCPKADHVLMWVLKTYQCDKCSSISSIDATLQYIKLCITLKTQACIVYILTPFVQRLVLHQYSCVFLFIYLLFFVRVVLQSGTRLRFHRGPNVEWQEADELGDSDEDSDDDSMMPPSSSIKVHIIH